MKLNILLSIYNGKSNSADLQVGNWDQFSLDITSDITEISEPDFYEEHLLINGFKVD